MKKKLLYICNRVFWPPMGGHEVEMFHYSRGLHEHLQYDVDTYVFDDTKNIDLEKKPAFINEVFIAEPIKRGTKIKNLITKSLVGRNAWPIQCSLYYSSENAEKLHRIINKKKYDAIFVDMTRLAPYFYSFSETDGKKILDIDDTLSKRYRRQLESLDQKTVIAGQYNEKLPKSLQKLLGSTFIKRIVLHFEIPRMENAEKRYGELYDNVIFVSSIETDEFNTKYAGNKAVTIAMGVDYTYYSEEMKVDVEKGTASFVGNMKTAANVDSVRMIIDHVLPFSKKLKRIDFIGGCSESLIEEYKDNPRVRFTGRVDDIRPHVKSSELFLSPLAYGTGIKTKILEAMAMGVPVVTNSIGAEGIPGENGVHWLTSDDPQSLGTLIDFLLDNPIEGQTIGCAGQEFVKREFQWEHIFNQFSRLGL